jgi:hypothetical protein
LHQRVPIAAEVDGINVLPSKYPVASRQIIVGLIFTEKHPFAHHVYQASTKNQSR